MAVLATLVLRDAVHNGTQAWDAWERIYGVSEAFVGKSDDLMPTEYLPVVEEVFGDGGANHSAVADHALLEEFRGRVGEMRSPSGSEMVGAGSLPKTKRNGQSAGSVNRLK